MMHLMYVHVLWCAVTQVILLLKSSDRVMHDLELTTAAQQQRQPAAKAKPDQKKQNHPQQQQQQQHVQQHHDIVQQPVACPACPQVAAAAAAPVPPQVILRQWHDLLPEREFRCFVHHYKLIAISQRDVSQHFPQLSMLGERDSIQNRITAFHKQHIRDTFSVDSCKCAAAMVTKDHHR